MKIRVLDYIRQNFDEHMQSRIIRAIRSGNDKVNWKYVLRFGIDEDMNKFRFIMGQFKHHLTEEGSRYWQDLAESYKEKING